MQALDKAMLVRQRRIDRVLPYLKHKIEIPDFKDVEGMIVVVYQKIRDFFKSKKQDKLTFSQLVPGDDKKSKVYTFIPLLHLNNERRIDLKQEKAFDEIEISMVGRKAN